MSFVSIVGAGPGDPELLTLKAVKAIQQAEVVIHDRLVHEAILALAPEQALRLYAGKEKGVHSCEQQEINQFLIDFAKAGKRVVRLKGGDPLIFGRGGEEAEALLKADIPFEIIPGVSSAHACAAAAGIPLTHRDFASGVRFVTGHRQKDQPLQLDWKSLADPDTTLVVFMGLATAEEICARLMAHGLPGTTPAVAIENGTLPGQRILRAGLSSLPAKLVAEKFQSPTLLLIGKTAGLDLFSRP